MRAALASMGLSLLEGYASRGAQKAQNILHDAEAKAANVVREGQNIEGAAQASFAGFMANLNNQRSLEAAGKAQANARANLDRMGVALTRGSVEDQIANAEAAGAYTAITAMSGSGGSSVDSISTAMRLKQQRAEFYTKERGKQMSYDQLQQITGIMPQTIAGLDIGTYSAPINYSTTFSKARPVQGNFLLDAAKWAVNNPGGAQQVAGGVSKFFSSGSSSASSLYALPTQSTGLGLKGGSSGLGLKL